ncbi:HEXXH motif domain-containing protein [Lentzea aerocolonigenes]|uniref:HEXXH motif domain-containing protein n=1 Tax=Lentzea aerocolonigenes TaxID=68170 RepID=UPI0004C34CBB|nr:HEXXH motif domain-containing protein [Lentzea aerocolonigenes]MCP2251258.1 HEXXH motif-containing protein [Lentzea aerocolonigenes]
MTLGALFHQMPWSDFDALARMDGDTSMVRRLRRAERSRRKLLLHGLSETSAKSPELFGPMPPLDVVLELFARVEDASPSAFDRLLAHPYTGSWAGYTTRLLRNGMDGVCPLWVHLGHLHAIAAAAAIRAGLDFEIAVPMWGENAVLPSLGVARLRSSAPFSVAVVRGGGGTCTVANEAAVVRLPDPLDTDGPGWWALRHRSVVVGRSRFSVCLDDLDPYRGLYEPVPSQRLDGVEHDAWRRLLDEAWQLLVEAVPDLARILAIGLNSLVPAPLVPFRSVSASTGEAFGSAVVGRPPDGAELAATLVHEFQHIVLGGILHLVQLYDDDPRERIYVPWRDDPRPLRGALQGVYAFAGVSAFWRALATARGGAFARRAMFEFAYWRGQTWHTFSALRDDETLTAAGRRFLTGIGDVLGPWQNEPIPEDVAELAAAATADHRAGWRIRHMRPDPSVVTKLVNAWRSGRSRPPATAAHTDLPPTPVPDGSWSKSRADLMRLNLSGADLESLWQTVPDATPADFAYASGRFADAAHDYRAELRADPDRPASLVGLGLALAATGQDPASRALLHCPELVRAVHRVLRHAPGRVPTPEHLASWIGQVVSGQSPST